MQINIKMVYFQLFVVFFSIGIKTKWLEKLVLNLNNKQERAHTFPSKTLPREHSKKIPQSARSIALPSVVVEHSRNKKKTSNS